MNPRSAFFNCPNGGQEGFIIDDEELACQANKLSIRSLFQKLAFHPDEIKIETT